MEHDHRALERSRSARALDIERHSRRLAGFTRGAEPGDGAHDLITGDPELGLGPAAHLFGRLAEERRGLVVVLDVDDVVAPYLAHADRDGTRLEELHEEHLVSLRGSRFFDDSHHRTPLFDLATLVLARGALWTMLPRLPIHAPRPHPAPRLRRRRA